MFRLSNEQYFMLASILANLLKVEVVDEALKHELSLICADIQEVLEQASIVPDDVLIDTIVDIQSDPTMDAGMDEQDVKAIVNSGQLEDDITEIILGD